MTTDLFISLFPTKEEIIDEIIKYIEYYPQKLTDSIGAYNLNKISINLRILKDNGILSNYTISSDKISISFTSNTNINSGGIHYMAWDIGLEDYYPIIRWNEYDEYLSELREESIDDILMNNI